jgi:hypothetical protein
MPINEADTYRTYVVPKLNNAGWEGAQISEQENFTAGRIMLPDNQAFRCLQKRRQPRPKLTGIPRKGAHFNGGAVQKSRV